MRQNVCHRGRAQRGGGLLLLRADLVQHRLDLSDDEGQGDEDGRDDHPGEPEDDLEPGAVERPEPAGRAPQHDEGDADDDRRDGEGQVDDALQQPAPAESPADQRQCRR